MRKYFDFILILLGVCFLQACADEEIVSNIDMGKEATVTLSLNFSEMDMVSPASRAAGNAIEAIEDVWVLFYGGDDQLVNYIYSGNESTYDNKEIPDNQRMKFSKKMPSATYKVYAVANVGSDFLEKYNTELQSIDGLKGISFDWSENVGSNNQMFGFFTEGSNYSVTNAIDNAITANGGGITGLSKVAPTDFDATGIAIANITSISAKLYRLVSKVTVAFDASNLQANTAITIKSIRLGNLPASCSLWKANKLAESDETGTSEYLEPTNLRVYRAASSEESVFPQNAHSKTGDCLFLFENRQGIDSHNSYEGQKDKQIERMPTGSFIEIEAEYNDETPLTGSHGKIIYRCMLGEDIYGSNATYNNYNVTRNRHYKVTLVFNKSARKDISWRIEYDEDEEVNIPSEVHISYRHMSKLSIPLRINGDKKISSVTAKIIENPWWDGEYNGKGIEALNLRNENKKNEFGFLAFDGAPSDNNNFGADKTDGKALSTNGDRIYTLALQTEALGFKSVPGINGDTFSGYNNFANTRNAMVEVTVKFAGGSSITKKVKIVQEPRIVNPVAIYRNYNEDNEFHIRLLNANGEEVQSYGTWKAYAESGKDWIQLKREDGAYTKGEITSENASGSIRFYYKPDGICDRESSRCGVIVVKFSNDNVEHRIYVRQGYAPIAIGNNSSLWTSFNYKGQDSKKNELFADSPLEEGAWLKRGNKQGILAISRNTTKFEERPSRLITTQSSNGVAWSSINASSWSDINVSNYRLPNNADIENIMGCKEHSGFGIAYTGEASETVGFNEESQEKDLKIGRRGIVICDEKGNNLFFPVGKTGYGRRNSTWNGGLHYSNEWYRYNLEENVGIYRPLLIDLYKAFGAYYWASSDAQLTFNYSLANIEYQSRTFIVYDACFVRFIYTGK